MTHRAVLYLIWLILALPLLTKAQNHPDKKYRDSLALIAASGATDSAKAKACFLLVDEWRETDTVLSKQYLEKGRQFSKGNKFLQAVLLYYSARQIATAYPDSAAKIYLQAEQNLQGFAGKEALLYRAMCWHDYARFLHQLKDDSETYIDILLNKTIPMTRQAGDSLYLGKNYLDIAFGFKNLRDFKKADEYLQAAISTLKKAPGSLVYLASAYHTLSENYSLSGHSAEAASLLDSMRVLLTPYPDAVAWIDYYAGEAMRLTIAEQFDSSLQVINKGITLARKLQLKYPEQRLLLQKFYALYNKKDLANARDVALDLLNQIPFIGVAANRVQIYYGLTVTYEELKNIPEAYKWLKKYSHLNDSLYRSNMEAKVNALEVKYRNAESQKKIAELNAANQEAHFAVKNSRLINWLLGSSCILLLTAMILGYLYYRKSKRSFHQQEQINITQAMLNGQEEERARIARDLHDGLGGRLASIKNNLSDFAGNKEEANNIAIHKVIDQLDGSVKELRQIAHNMMPEMLLKLGLKAALSDLCESLASENMDIEFQFLSEDHNIPEREQLNIYRIIQELLTNVVRHAGAKNVLLQCSRSNNVFFITVEDDGKGINPEKLKERRGAGLNNIESRVAYLNGRMEILPRGDKTGTSINIELHVTA